jgi:hypothetical protein
VESPSTDPRVAWQTQQDDWARTNSNILQFLKAVPAERQTTLCYEDLVQAPESQLKGLCGFLGLPYAPQMCAPYQESNLALFQPADAHQPSTNHPDVLKHKGIEPSLADAWRTVRVPRPLSTKACSIAAQLRYAICQLTLPLQLSTCFPEIAVDIRIVCELIGPPLFAPGTLFLRFRWAAVCSVLTHLKLGSRFSSFMTSRALRTF